MDLIGKVANTASPIRVLAAICKHYLLIKQ